MKQLLQSNNQLMELLLFTRHLHSMIVSGIPLSESLEALQGKHNSDSFQSILLSLQTDIQNGLSLASACAKHPNFFNSVYISMLEVGEEAGNLDETLRYTSNQLQKELSLRKKIQSALLYPVLVITTVLVIGSSIAFFVLPRLSAIYRSVAVDLPISTRILLSIADYIESYGLMSLFGLGILFLAALASLRNQTIRYYWHWASIRVPIFGALVKYQQLSKLSRTLALLLKSGVPVVQSLELCANSLDNLVYKHSLKQVQHKVDAGSSLAQAFQDVQRLPIYPIIVYKMLLVGDRTGSLDEVFMYLSEYYDEEIDSLSQNLSSMLEPVLLLSMGLVVAFIALAVISPIYQFTQVF